MDLFDVDRVVCVRHGRLVRHLFVRACVCALCIPTALVVSRVRGPESGVTVKLRLQTLDFYICQLEPHYLSLPLCLNSHQLRGMK